MFNCLKYMQFIAASPGAVASFSGKHVQILGHKKIHRSADHKGGLRFQIFYCITWYKMFNCLKHLHFIAAPPQELLIIVERFSGNMSRFWVKQKSTGLLTKREASRPTYWWVVCGGSTPSEKQIQICVAGRESFAEVWPWPRPWRSTGPSQTSTCLPTVTGSVTKQVSQPCSGRLLDFFYPSPPQPNKTYITR